ncbi:hypothetical protein RhiJN_00571 [Ceratobasidium sp. AG-Ba]|nr:hypothetical protein RhiJN_00571 [Ceratobasidium sp. AG-Ba]QRW01594.1 hypothetical protein RhiLY_00591 [Ceratobasidium sp. AG-Ba]
MFSCVVGAPIKRAEGGCWSTVTDDTALGAVSELVPASNTAPGDPRRLTVLFPPTVESGVALPPPDVDQICLASRAGSSGHITS